MRLREERYYFARIRPNNLPYFDVFGQCKYLRSVVIPDTMLQRQNEFESEKIDRISSISQVLVVEDIPAQISGDERVEMMENQIGHNLCQKTSPPEPG